MVGLREPCPCGSGKRYKACHGKTSLDAFVARPFAGREDETEWVALREVVPAATAPLTVLGHEDRTVVLSTVLPLAWPAMVRADGSIFLGLQVQTRGGDVSRDLASALELALTTSPGNPVVPTGLPGAGPRLQDLLDPTPLAVSVHEGFDFWIEGASATEEVAASMERANASVVPTVRLEQVRSAYWCRMRERAHLRWVLPEDEEPLLDAMARLAARPDGLGIGADSRYIGSFRAHGLLVPVWDLAPDTEAAAVEEPAAALRARLDAELADPRALTGEEKRARQGLLSRQLTLR